MKDFDYGKAESDLYDSGCPYSEEIFECHTEKGINEFMRENGLDPDKYYKNTGAPDNSSNNGDSGCYLTTACVVAKGLPDDCMELQTLRAYRDSYLKSRVHGEDDIRSYYELAPSIVAAINKLPDSKSIWESVYFELIEPCVDLIKQHNYEETYHLYRGYTMILGKRYLTQKKREGNESK